MGSIHPHGRPSYDRIVRDIYGTLAGDADFDASLVILGDLFNAHIRSLHVADATTGAGSLRIRGPLTLNQMQSLDEEYACRWSGANPWMERGMPLLTTAGYGAGSEVVGDHELLRSQYYEHFLRRLDIRHGLAVNLSLDITVPLQILTLNRPASAGEFDASDLALIARLRPHLVTAYDIHRRVAGLEHTGRTLRAGFDSLPMGLLVLDAEGRVLEANAEADRLLADHRGVARTADGHLRLCRGPAQARFAAAMLRMATGDAPAPESLLLTHAPDSVASALVLHLCALPAGTAPVPPANGRVIAFLYELTQQSADAIALRVLQTVLALTPMESRVVLGLRADGDCALAASHLGIATSTLRSHLKHAFRKTGTSRQSELVRLAERLVSTLPH